MKTRALGTNGPELTVIGFGAWAIGGPWLFGWGPVDDAKSVKAIQSAIDLGINWIDTAAVYGLGHSEEIVARALDGVRGRVFVATKCGLVWDDKGNVKNDLHPDSIRREVHASLKRLQVDTIDLYQFHWPDPAVPVEDSWEAMLKLQQEGKVRYAGVSNFDVPLLERCGAPGPVQSLQPPFSLLNPAVADSILPYCRNNGIGVVAYSPMQSGLLSGTFDLAKLAPDDWRRRKQMFREPRFTRATAMVSALNEMAKSYHATVGQLAIAWVLRNPATTAAIVGGRTPEQVKETAGAADINLSDADVAQLTRLSEEFAQFSATAGS